MRACPFLVVAGTACALLAIGATAATLPPHRTLRVLIVSDEVNPHGLPPAELTQPGDLSAALQLPGAALGIDTAPDGVIELPTNDLATATALLSRPACDPRAFDVLAYFAHRIPDDGPDAPSRQDAFTSAVADFVAQGGGLVSFHHGAYLLPGKEGMLALIGGQATGAVPWEPLAGQDIIAVSPAHFVASNGLTWDRMTAHEDAARGIPPGSYPSFNNAPDERYPTLDILPGAGSVEILFASFYDGAPRLLGFTHERPGWLGRVVAWQPGEYQPNACDPSHRTFQILVNAIVHAADALDQGDALLRVTKDGGAVRLAWSSGPRVACVLRSQDPADVSQHLGVSQDRALEDRSPPPGLVAYVITTR